MKVYADNAATTQVSKAALNAMIEATQNEYGNPSSMHSFGIEAAKLLESSRASIAKRLGAKTDEIYFTSGGTEADNWALHAGFQRGLAKGKKRIVSTKFEHHAVLHTLNKLEKMGAEITLLDVYENGIIKLEDLENALGDDVAMVSIMFGNNEIGTVQPIKEIGELCKARGILFHTDAVQAVGHIPVDVVGDNIDMLSLSAHKFHGPKGIGALYCRKGVPLPVFMDGGAQERGKRGGTEPVPLVAGMAAALDEACENMEKTTANLNSICKLLVQEVLKIPRSRLNGDPVKRLPGILNFIFEGIEGESLLLYLDLKGIAASSGSACTSGSLDPSHVLLSLGLPHEIAHGSLRLSFSEYNTLQQAKYIAETLPPIVERLRAMSPMWERIMAEKPE